jgi:hypothetical protein
MNCAVVTDVVLRQKSRPAASKSNISNSSTMGPPPSSPTHTHVDPPVLVKLQHRTLIVVPMNTTGLGHLRGGLAFFHRLAILYQTLRYLKLPREQHVCPAVTGGTTAPCAPTQSLQHPWALCAFLPRTKCTSTAAARKEHHQLTTTTVWPS